MGKQKTSGRPAKGKQVSLLSGSFDFSKYPMLKKPMEVIGETLADDVGPHDNVRHRGSSHSLTLPLDCSAEGSRAECRGASRLATLDYD